MIKIEEKSRINSIKLRNLEDVYDLSPCQQDDLEKYINSPTEGWYHENLVYKFKGKIDIDIFKKCWKMILKRHSILRSAFLVNNLEKPVQIVLKNVELPIEILEWYDFDEETRKQKLDKLIDEDKISPYNLEKAPLIRLSLILCPNDNFVLWWRFHHILMDGWSFSIVLLDFLSLYRKFLECKIDSNTILQDEFKDYIYYRKLRETSKEEIFWKEYFKDFNIQGIHEKRNTLLSRDFRNRAKQSRVDMELSDLYYELNHVIKDNGLSMNTIFQGVFTLLSTDSYKQSRDIVTGQVVADRPLKLEDSYKRVGLFVNTLPIRAKIQEDVKFIEWLKDLQVSMLNVFQYSVSSEREIKKWIGAPMEKKLFNNVFVFENIPLENNSYEGLPFEISSYDLESHPYYSLILFLWPDEKLHFKAVYNNEVYSEEYIARFLKNFRLIIENFIESPDLSIEVLIKKLIKE